MQNMKWSLVCALDMATHSITLSMVYNGDILHSLCPGASTYCGSLHLVCLVLKYALHLKYGLHTILHVTASHTECRSHTKC